MRAAGGSTGDGSAGKRHSFLGQNKRSGAKGERGGGSLRAMEGCEAEPNLCLHDALHVGRVTKLGGYKGTWGVC